MPESAGRTWVTVDKHKRPLAEKWLPLPSFGKITASGTTGSFNTLPLVPVTVLWAGFSITVLLTYEALEGEGLARGLHARHPRGQDWLSTSHPAAACSRRLTGTSTPFLPASSHSQQARAASMPCSLNIWRGPQHR